MVQQVAKLEEFDEIVKNNPIVIVDFTATWCGPCKMIGPKFEEFSKEAANEKVKFIKVDVDEASDVSEKYGISAMPTFMVRQQ